MNEKNNVGYSLKQIKACLKIWHYFMRERIERMKDRSIKNTMKSWIMLSDKELDETQVYMQEQGKAQGESEDIADSDNRKDMSEEVDIKSHSEGTGKTGRLSRDEEIEQLMQEVGQEVVRSDDEEIEPRRRRKRHQEKKSRKSRSVTEEWNSEDRKQKPTDDTIIRDDNTMLRDHGEMDYTREGKEEEAKHMEPEVKKVDFSEEATEKSQKTEKSTKPQKSGGMGKVFAAGIGVVLVLIIAGLGYQNQSLQKQNVKLKAQVASFEKEKKDAEQASEEQALQTKNEDGVVVNTDKMFASVKIGDKEYKLLAKVSDFTKDGWKLEALRNENATLVPGGKLEKDACLTSTDGKKIGVIIRNMSDKNQKVSDCIVTKLSFSKEMFDGQITLPESLSFSSTEKELKKAGFKKNADGVYCYTSKKIKDDTIKMPMADGESVSEITLERTVDENAATATTASSSATTETNRSSTTSAKDTNESTTSKTATTESAGTTTAAQSETGVEDFSQKTSNAISEE